MGYYNFTYSITAKCHRMQDCLGAPGGILAGWARLNPADADFAVDEEGWLRRQGGGQALAGLYDPSATGLGDYSFVVPVIPPQVRAGVLGVAFRTADRNNYYCFLWDDGTLGWTNSQRLVRVRNGVPQVIAEASSPLNGGYMYLIGVTVAANRLVVAVNGQTVFDYTDIDNPVLAGGWGIAVSGAEGARFAGVYRQAIAPLDVVRSFSASIADTKLGMANSELVNGTCARDLLGNSVAAKRLELGLTPEELIVYAYTTRAEDFFVQTYFDAGEPVVYSQYGNYYTYAYLKIAPRVPEAPQDFRGTVTGGYITWSWTDVTTVENGYFIYDAMGRRLASLGPSVTSWSEPIVDDGVTVTRRITAYNNVGESVPVETSLFVPIIVPGAPAWFGGQALSSTNILWTWSEVPYAQTYELVDSDDRVVASLPAGTLSYREEGLLPATAYTRGLRAVRKGQAGPVVYATVETPSRAGAIPAGLPANFRGEAIGLHVARWLWDYTGTAAHFLLIDTDGTIIAEVPGSERNHIEYDLPAGVEYTRILVAVDPSGRMSAPVMASLTLRDDFVEVPCEPPPPPPRYVEGFASGVGDGEDLATSLEYGELEFNAVVRATGEIEETVAVEEPAACEVRLFADGTEPVARDYGAYELEISAQPPADVEFKLTAETLEPVPAEYHLEADVNYLKCYPVEVPFEADIVGYALDPSATELSDTCQVHCEVDVTRKRDVTFNYQLEITYTSEDPSYSALVDIVWIVDYSGSMGAYMSEVAQNASLFCSSLASSNLDYRLAVVAYEASAYKRTYGGKEWTTSASEFASMVQIPTSGGTEKGVGATLYALNNYSFRSGALKYLIILTDEDADDAGSYNIASVVNTLKANGVVFSCIYNPSSAGPYATMASGTGGLAIDIDSSDWGDTLADLVSNIRSRVTLAAILGRSGTGALTATAPYGTSYTEADSRTLYQIVADYIAGGSSGLPTNFLTSGYNTITSYRLIPPAISGVHVSLSSGSLTTSNGDAKIVAYSTLTTTSRQILSTQAFTITAPAGAIGPDSAVRNNQSCGELVAPEIQALMAWDTAALSATPRRYWVTTGGGLRAFTCSPEGFDYVRWYRTDYTAALRTYRKRVGGTLNGSHTATSPLLVSAVEAAELAADAVPTGCQPVSEFRHLTSLGWRLGSAPFDGYKRNTYTAGVLEGAPSVAYFVKDIYLAEAPSAAAIYIASDDGMALYVNGTLVADRTGENHTWHYWDYTFDITQHLAAGRNRITVLVDNGYRNTGGTSGSFDCELAVTTGGQTTYPILRGAGNYGRDECLWWYYGRPAGVVTPPADARGLEWHARDYGVLDLTAHRVESLTAGAVALLGGDGLVRAYLTRTPSTCDTPVSGAWNIYCRLDGQDQRGMAASRTTQVLSGPYAVSGPNIQQNATGNTVAYLASPAVELAARNACWSLITATAYSTSLSGSATASLNADGRSSLGLSTSVTTYRPQYASFSIVSNTYSIEALNETATASNPQALTAETAAAVLAPYVEARPEVQQTAYALQQVRAVSHTADAAVYTAADGSSPVYGYPLRASRAYTTWQFAERIYAYQGWRVLVSTADLVPLGVDGRPYTGTRVTWSLEVLTVPDGATVALEEVDGIPAVVGESRLAETQTIRGWAGLTRPVAVEVALVVPAVKTMTDPAVAVELSGDDNVRIRLSSTGEEGAPGGQLVSYSPDEVVTVTAVPATDYRPRRWYGPWHALEVVGQVQLAIDVAPPDGAVVSAYGFELSGQAVQARFTSGGETTADPTDRLVLTGGMQAEKTVKRPWAGTPLVQPAGTALGDGEVELTLVGLAASADPAGEGLSPASLSYEAWPLDAGVVLEVTGIEAAEGSPFVGVRVIARPAAEGSLPWRPASTPGFYYWQGEERYLYGECAVRSAGGEAWVTALARMVLAEGESRTVALRVRVPADGQWHVVAPDLFTLFATHGLLDEGEEDVERFEAELLDGEGGEVRCDPAGTGGLEVRVTGQPVALNAAVLDDELEAAVYPEPVNLAPVTALLADGTPLAYVRFTSGTDRYSLDCTELLEGSGGDTLLLAYPDADPASVRLRFCPKGDSRWYKLSRFQLCGHRLRLPVTVIPGDLVEVTYRVRDSFTLEPGVPEGGATLKVHSNRVGPGDVVYLYYETGSGARMWREADISPLRRPPGEGFLRLGYPGEPAQLEVSAVNRPQAGSAEPLVLEVRVADASGNGLVGQEVDAMAGERLAGATTGAHGRAQVKLAGPFGAGPLELVARCGSLSRTLTVDIPAPPPVISLAVEQEKSVLYPGESTRLAVRVLDQGAPAAGVEVAAAATYGSVTPSADTTDACGRVFIHYTAPSRAGTADAVRVWPVSEPGNYLEATVYIGDTVGIGPGTENTVGDLPDYSVWRLGVYSVEALATTPPEWL